MLKGIAPYGGQGGDSMLVMIAIGFAVLTVASALQARRAAAFAGKQRAVLLWATLAVCLGFITCMIGWALFREPRLLWWVPPSGFGVDWRCADNVPQSARVCFRQ